ncbi:MAG: glutamate ligase [Candidatus Pacebacteria bacterium]|nr:glutamate ligase [Candidatus Paceibacterota bacterium]
MNNYYTNIIRNIQSLSTIILVKEAISRGIKVNHINKDQREMSFLELSYKNHFEYIKGQSSSRTSFPAFYATENKSITKDFLLRSGISISKGILIHKENIEELSKFVEKIGYPLVIKPLDGCHGELVFIGINTEEKCKEAIERIFKKYKYALVEDEFNGKEFRFIATRNKVLAVAYREAANVTGDGIYNIKELVKIKNNNSMRGDSNEKPLVKIKIDSMVKKYLKEQNIKIDKSIKKGEKVYLRETSNISTGGDSIDVTDQVHPELKKIAVRAVRAIPGLAYAGIDVMINKNINKNPTKKSYIIIEINSSPMISMHHFPYKGKPRNVAKGIFDILFPETK